MALASQRRVSLARCACGLPLMLGRRRCRPAVVKRGGGEASAEATHRASPTLPAQLQLRRPNAGPCGRPQRPAIRPCQGLARALRSRQRKMEAVAAGLSDLVEVNEIGKPRAIFDCRGAVSSSHEISSSSVRTCTTAHAADRPLVDDRAHSEPHQRCQRIPAAANRSRTQPLSEIFDTESSDLFAPRFCRGVSRPRISNR